MNEIIRINHLSKIYNKKTNALKVLDDISMNVYKGEFVAVTGQSGSGKSTLMNIIGCLDRAESGQYLLDGKDVCKMNDSEMTRIRSSKIGFVFQSFNLLPSLTAIENVELPLLYKRINKTERERIAQEALECVGLSERIKHLPNEMSGGQQQRTAIARAIAVSPELLLADEPTGSLDKASGEEVLSIIRKMNNSGVTVVMITHDINIAALADRQIVISDGRIIN